MKILLLSILTVGTLTAPVMSYSMLGRLGQQGLRSRLGAYGLIPRLGKRGLTTGLRTNPQGYSSLKHLTVPLVFAGGTMGLLMHQILEASRVYKQLQKEVERQAEMQLNYEGLLDGYLRKMKTLSEEMKAEKKELQGSIEYVKQQIEMTKDNQRRGESLLGKNIFNEEHLQYLFEELE